jgi:hypothetical protein
MTTESLAVGDVTQPSRKLFSQNNDRENKRVVTFVCDDTMTQLPSNPNKHFPPSAILFHINYAHFQRPHGRHVRSVDGSKLKYTEVGWPSYEFNERYQKKKDENWLLETLVWSSKLSRTR